MLFPNAIIDNLVQICDMFRIDASKSFHGSGEILTEVNIYPDFVNNPADVYNVYVEDCPEDWYLDYAYDTDGEYTIRVELVTASDSKFKDYVVNAITEAEDNLQSDDAMIYSLESELKKYLPEGRNSWKYKHREALGKMIDYMYRNGIYNPDGSKIIKSQLIGDKLSEWSKYETMVLIFQELKTSNIELFNEKIADYEKDRDDARAIYKFEYDSNKDSVVDDTDNATATRPTHFRRGYGERSSYDCGHPLIYKSGN